MIVSAEGNCANVRTVNGKSYVNGIEVPNKPGVCNIGGAKVTVANSLNGNITISGNSNMQINMGGNGNTQINIASGHERINADRKRKSYSAHKEGDDYIINGMASRIEKNILVHGDVVVSGMNNVVKYGKYKHGLPELEIKGDLVVSGMGNNIKYIVACGGQLVNNGMNNTIV